MEYFARLDENNVVLNVHCVNNEDVQNLPFPESEPVGIAFLRSVHGQETRWAQTSIDWDFRYRYASINSVFHPEFGEHGAFVNPKEIDYFVWDEATYDWIPPIPYPTDGREYKWSEESMRWIAQPRPAPQTTFIG
jgi:hypothetical protein